MTINSLFLCYLTTAFKEKVNSYNVELNDKHNPINNDSEVAVGYEVSLWVLSGYHFSGKNETELRRKVTRKSGCFQSTSRISAAYLSWYNGLVVVLN
jgi:hypothetical protein